MVYRRTIFFTKEILIKMELNKQHVATLAATEFIVCETIKKVMGANLQELEDAENVDSHISSHVRRILAKDEHNPLPARIFKSNNILFEEVLKACGLADQQMTSESEEERINRWQKEVSDLYGNETFGLVAESLAEKISGAKEVISGVKEMVTSLASDIESKCNTYIASDPFLHKHYKPVKADVSFDPFPYEVLSLTGPVNNLRDYVYGEVGLQEYDINSRSHFNVAMEKFAASKLKDDRVDDIEVSKEIKEAIIEEVNKKNDHLLANVIRNTVNLLVSKKQLIAMKNRMMNAYKRTETTEACIMMLGHISDIRGCSQEIMRVVSAMEFGSALETFSNNISFTDDCTDLCAFYVSWHRTNTFKETVLFRNKMINPDLQARCKEEGIEPVDVARHVNKIYGSITMPTTGATLKSICEQKERIAKKVERESSQLEIRIRAGVAEKKRNAFFSVVHEWLSNSDNENVPTGSELVRFVKRRAADLVSKDTPVEDELYNICMKVMHKDTFVSTLYKRLGMEYHRMVADNKNITVGDIAMTNLSTYAELITEFISERFMAE